MFTSRAKKTIALFGPQTKPPGVRLGFLGWCQWEQKFCWDLSPGTAKGTFWVAGDGSEKRHSPSPSQGVLQWKMGLLRDFLLKDFSFSLIINLLIILKADTVTFWVQTLSNTQQNYVPKLNYVGFSLFLLCLFAVCSVNAFEITPWRNQNTQGSTNPQSPDFILN